MTAALPPHLIAALDQESAACNSGLDEMLAAVVEMLADGIDPNVAAQVIAAAIYETSPGRACTALGYALVRLAKQDGGRS